jgi:BlaI family penicillinase repressor
MRKLLHSNLSRRERQIMDVLYRRGSATAGDVMKELPGEPSDSTVRTHLRILEEKGHVKHQEEGLRYVYSPTASRNSVRQSALKHLIDTFFDGSSEKVVAALIGAEGGRLSREELRRIAQMVEKAEKAEKEGRKP